MDCRIRFKPLVATLLALLCAAGGAAAGTSGAADLAEADFYLLDVRASGQLLARNVPAYRAGDDYLIEFGEFLAAVEFPIHYDGERWSGWYREESLRFDWAPTLDAPMERVPPSSFDWIDNAEGFFVPAEALESWFDLELAVNDRQQTLTVASEEPLPFEQWKQRRLSRYGHRSAERLPADVVVDDQYRWLTPPLLNVAAAVRTGEANDTTLNTASSSVTMGLDLLRHSVTYTGSFLAGSYGDETPSETTRRLTVERAATTADGTLGFGATRYLVGDIYQPETNLVANGHAGRGVAWMRSPDGQIGNQTRVRIVGDGPPGWEVELYRNDALIDFGTVTRDGRYEFEAQELMFGENRFVARIFGPQGQMREQEQIYWGGGSNLERGDYDYSLSHIDFDRHFIDGAPDNADALPASYSTDLRASRAFTDDMQLGASISRVGLGNRLQNGVYRDTEYLSVFGRMKLGPGILLTEGSKQLLEGGALKVEYLTGRAGHNVRLAHLSLGDFESPTTLQTVRLRSLNELSFIGGQEIDSRYWNYNLTLQQRRKADDTSDFRLFNRIGSRVGTVNLTNDFEFLARPGQDELTGQLMLAGRYRRMNFRGNVHYQFIGRGNALRQISATLNWASGPRVSNNLQVIQGLAEDKSTYVTNLTSLRIGNYDLTFSAGTDLDAAWQVGVGFNLSLGYDRTRGGFVTDRRALAGTGRAAMNLFVDHDNDGLRDADEPPVTWAKYRQHDLTGSREGVLSIHGLPSYRPVRIDTDEFEFDDPFLVPRSRIYEVFTHAGSEVRIDVPVVMTGDIEGYVYKGTTDRKVPLRGATVILVDSRGEEVAAARSEFDGYYSFTRVPAGDYQVKVSIAEDAAPQSTQTFTLDGQVGYVVLDEIYL